MLDFSGNDAKAKLVAVYYAEEFKNDVVLAMLTNSAEVKNKEEAILLAEFFWQLVDATARDREEGKVVLGEANLQYWVERLLNIIGGYLKRNGYEVEWEKVCDEA
jgi:hypothetical protein